MPYEVTHILLPPGPPVLVRLFLFFFFFFLVVVFLFLSRPRARACVFFYTSAGGARAVGKQRAPREEKR